MISVKFNKGKKMTFDEWFSSVFGTIQTHQAEGWE